jgi:hypothetical protein
MKNNNYEWQYGDNGFQTYHECFIGKDYLCIWANKGSSNPNMYMITYTKNGRNTNVYDKIYNDQQRKKGNCSPSGVPTSVRLFGSEDIEYLKKKLIYCYEHDKQEITR